MRKDVIENEKRLNEIKELFSELETILDKLEFKLEDIAKLKEYYGSEEYRNDVRISNNSQEYDDIVCGVLTEDEAFNVIGDSYDLSINMLELATKMLKEY